MKMTSHEYEVAKGVATRVLKPSIDYDIHGNMYFEIAGQKFEFKGKTDAQILEELSRVFTNINNCFYEVINETVLSFVSQNKLNFN